MAGWLAPVLAGAAKYGPKVGQVAVNRLPWITAGAGALSQRDRGLGGMLQGGILGGAAGFGVGGPLSGVMRPAALKMAGLAKGAGLAGPSVGALTGLTRAAVPLAAGGALGTLAGGISGPAAGAVSGAVNTGQNVGSGFLVQNLATGEQFLTGPQNALPGGMGQYGYIPPIGTQADQVDPTSPFSGRRLGTRLDARANAAALNILMPTVRKYAEQRAKDELTRQLTAAGVRQNIATNALLTEISARKDAEMGRRAAEQAGNAVTQNYATYQ